VFEEGQEDRLKKTEIICTFGLRGREDGLGDWSEAPCVFDRREKGGGTRVLLVGVLVEVPWVNSVRNQVEIGPRQIPDFSTAARTLDMVTCPKGSQVSYAACH
jgi:hypothetical protein